MHTSPPPPTIINIYDSSPSKKTINNITLSDHSKTLREMDGFLKIYQRTKDKSNHPQPLKSKTTSPPMKIMIIHTLTNTTTNA